LYTPSWHKTAYTKTVSSGDLKKIQTTGQAENYLKGRFGKLLTKEFREPTQSNAYQWNTVFFDGDMYKGGMNDQGVYISPSRDVVVVWFGNGIPEISMKALARTITKLY